MPPKLKKPSKEEQEPSNATDNAHPSNLKTPSPEPQTLSIPNEKGKEIHCHLYNPPASPSEPPRLIFTHGAGGDLSSHAIKNFSQGFSTVSPLLCFKGSLNLASRIKSFSTIISHELNTQSVMAFGGRSMGARAAVQASSTNHPDIKALVLVSYPLHKDTDVRDKIILDLKPDVDVLFMIGDKDSMCNIKRLNAVREKMRARTWLVVVEGAGHGMDVTPKKGTDGVGELTGRVAAEWVESRDGGRREGRIWWKKEEGTERWSGWEEEGSWGKAAEEDQEEAVEEKATESGTVKRKSESSEPVTKSKSKSKSTTETPTRTSKRLRNKS